MNTHNEPEFIETDSGEATELAKPADFGKTLSFLNPSEMPDLENADVGMSIEPKYLEFKSVGQAVRAIFNGVTSINTRDRVTQELKPIPAVVLQTKDGILLNAGASLVQQMQKLQPGTAVQITFSGTEKTGSGNNVNKFDVRLLDVPRVNMPTVSNQPQLTHTNPAPAEKKPQFKNTFLSTQYWTKATELRFTQQEGLDHLAECGNDFEEALARLTGDLPV